MKTHITRYVESIRSAIHANSSKERLWVREGWSTDIPIVEELTQRGRGWTGERWTIGAIGSEEPGTDGLVHTDDRVEVLQEVTGMPECVVMPASNRGRSVGTRLELSSREGMGG